MEKCISWIIDLALWLVMRMAFVTVPFRDAFKKFHGIQKKSELKMPALDGDLSIPVILAKEYLDDQDHSTAEIMEKFKALVGMYSFSVPILIGFLSSRIVLLPRWSLAVFGVMVCLPGFCMIKYFSVRTHVSRTLSQEELSIPFRQQQVDQINWYYNKGATINANNNHSVNIYLATYRWLGLSLIVILSMALLLKFPPATHPAVPANIFFNNAASPGAKGLVSAPEAKTSSNAPR